MAGGWALGVIATSLGASSTAFGSAQFTVGNFIIDTGVTSFAGAGGAVQASFESATKKPTGNSDGVVIRGQSRAASSSDRQLGVWYPVSAPAVTPQNYPTLGVRLGGVDDWIAPPTQSPWLTPQFITARAIEAIASRTPRAMPLPPAGQIRASSQPSSFFDFYWRDVKEGATTFYEGGVAVAQDVGATIVPAYIQGNGALGAMEGYRLEQVEALGQRWYQGASRAAGYQLETGDAFEYGGALFAVQDLVGINGIREWWNQEDVAFGTTLNITDARQRGLFGLGALTGTAAGVLDAVGINPQIKPGYFNPGNYHVEQTTFVSLPRLPKIRYAPRRISGNNPPINRPRQALHTDGTEGKSQFKKGLDVDAVVEDAWAGGTPKFNKNGEFIGKVKEYKRAVGTDSQKSVDVRFSREKGIHGFPSNKKQ